MSSGKGKGQVTHLFDFDPTGFRNVPDNTAAWVYQFAGFLERNGVGNIHQLANCANQWCAVFGMGEPRWRKITQADLDRWGQDGVIRYWKVL